MGTAIVDILQKKKKKSGLVVSAFITYKFLDVMAAICFLSFLLFSPDDPASKPIFFQWKSFPKNVSVITVETNNLPLAVVLIISFYLFM